MSKEYLKVAATPGVKAAQEANGSADLWAKMAERRNTGAFTEAEMRFIRDRDSFYLATVSEAGWPYVQHRGGPPGFVSIIDDRTFAFPEFRGNRQYISVGNLSTNDRASLIFVDYPSRRRLKMFAHLEVWDRVEDEALAARLAVIGDGIVVERSVVGRLEAFDWNCSQHITPRYSESDLVAAGILPVSR